MGGHGGLNILPQKKWNVYNWDNRIKVMQNEKLVKEEVEKMRKKKEEKLFHEKINSLKKGEKFEDKNIHQNGIDIGQDEKNRIYLDIMKNKNLSKVVDNDVYFENRLNPLKENEQLTLVEERKLKSEYQKNINNEYEADEENTSANNTAKGSKLFSRYSNLKKKFENQNAEITFKNSIKNHLEPWYLKKSKEEKIKKLAKIEKLFSSKKPFIEGSSDGIGVNRHYECDDNTNVEEEVDKNKLIKNYEDFYENLEYDLKNKITVKDHFANKGVIVNNNLEIDSDHLEFLKGEKNLMDFLQRKRSQVDNDTSINMTTNQAYKDESNNSLKNDKNKIKYNYESIQEYLRNKKERKHKKEKKHKKAKKHKKNKEKKHKKDKNHQDKHCEKHKKHEKDKN